MTALPPAHPNWTFALSVLAAMLPGSTAFNPDKITGTTPADWVPFEIERRDIDDVEDDLLSRCTDMTGPLIFVNDTSFTAYTWRSGPYFLDAADLADFVKNFEERAGSSYSMDGHVIILSPATGIVVMVMDDGYLAKVKGRAILQVSC